MDELGVGGYHAAGYSLGARVAIQLADPDRVASLIAIAPDGLGTPLERVQGTSLRPAAAWRALAPVATLRLRPAPPVPVLREERSLPWQRPADARQLLADFAGSTGYDATNWASLFDMPTHLHTITQPALFLQGTADPLISSNLPVRRTDPPSPRSTSPA